MDEDQKVLLLCFSHAVKMAYIKYVQVIPLRQQLQFKSSLKAQFNTVVFTLMGCQ